MNVLEGAVLTAEFEVKAARLLGVAGLPRLVAEPAFYGAFVVGALSSTGGGIDPERALFLAIGVVGIQCVGMMSQVIYRWTLERKWALGSLKLSSGVPQLGYYLGMLLVPLLSLLVRASVALLVVATICSFTLRVDPVALCGLFWSALGCVLTALITSYQARDFVVSLALTPLMFSAPTLYSLDQAPAFLRVISAVNPLTYQLALLRSVAARSWPSDQLIIVLAMTLALCAIGYVSTGRMRTVSNEG